MLRHLRKLPRHNGAASIASTQKVRVRRDRNAPWRQLVLIAMFLGLSVHRALGVSAESEGSSPVSAAAAQQVKPPPAISAPEEHGLSQKAVEIGRVFGFPITNSMVVSWSRRRPGN